MSYFVKNLIDFLGPHKGLGLLIVDPNIFFDSRDEIRNAAKNSSADPFSRQFAKPSLDQVHPRGTGWRKMQLEARMLPQPLFNVRMGMSAVVVEDQMKIPGSGHFSIERPQKFQELLVTMTRITRPNHCSIQHVQGGKKARRSVAFVIVGHRPASAFFHRQSGLGPVQGLDLRLLVDAQNQGFIRGIQVETDHIREFFHEMFVFRHLEGLHTMRLKAVSLPHPSHSRMADANLLASVRVLQ